MAFSEGFVEADGFRIRYMQAGVGDALVHVHGAGGMRLSTAHELLGEHFRVIAFEAPGFGDSAANERTKSIDDMGRTMNAAVAALGIDQYTVWGTSFGGRVALAMAQDKPEAVSALVLESPAAIRPEGHVRPAGGPEQNASLLYAHPERQPARVPLAPGVLQKQEALLARLRGPERAEMEERLASIATRTLVLFGTEDRMIPSEMGSVYKANMPNCSFIVVYDAGHAIAADRPEAFTELVGEFLGRGDRFVVSARPSVIHP